MYRRMVEVGEAEVDAKGLARLVAAGALLVGGCASQAGQEHDPAGQRPDPAQPPDPTVAASPWAWELPACVAFHPGDYASPAHRVEVETRRAADTIEYVETYQPGWAERAVAEIRQVLNQCATYEHGGSGDPAAFREQHVIVETDFAGDESMLVEVVRQHPPELQTSYAVVVRRGEQVVTVRGPEAKVERAICLATLATCPAGQA